MKMQLTESQLMDEWAVRSFPEHVADGYRMERVDGIDADAVMKARMNDWYRNLLRNAPIDLLYPLDIADRCVISPDGYLTLPEGTLRVVEIRMDGWTGVPVITCNSRSKIAMLQQSRYTCGTPRSPVAIISGNRVGLYPAAGALSSLKAVVDMPGIYALDSAAFETIKPFAL